MLTKVHIVKAMVFPVVMYWCGSWAIKKAECWRIDAFELWCCRRLLKSPLDWKEIKLVKPKGNHLIFIRRIVAEAEAPCHFLLHVTPLTVAYQASPSMGFSRQEYWNGLPFPSPEYLSDPGIEPSLPHSKQDALPSEPPGKSCTLATWCKNMTHWKRP